MPVLTFDDQAKRFILPSTQKEGVAADQQGWVEMTTYPLCADDYAVYYSKLYGGMQPTLNAEILARRVKDWNYTDKSGVKLAINGENIGHLPLSDVGFLMNKIQEEVTEELDETLKETSSPTSSTPPTDSPQV